MKGALTADTISQLHPSLQPASVIEMDLSSIESVRHAADDFLRREDSPHVLIANAGIMASHEARSKDGFELQFPTNHLAHFALFQFLKPAMLRAATREHHSRFVSVSSGAHRRRGICLADYNLVGTYEPWLTYGQSKTANIYIANEAERRFGGQGLHSWSVHPGIILETTLGRHQEGGRLGHEQRTLQDERVARVVKTAEQGAATQVWAAVAKCLQGRGGSYLEDCQIAEPAEVDFRPGKAGYAQCHDMADNVPDHLPHHRCR